MGDVPGTKVWVGNLGSTCEERDLRDEFSKFGELNKVRLLFSLIKEKYGVDQKLNPRHKGCPWTRLPKTNRCALTTTLAREPDPAYATLAPRRALP